MTRHLISSGNPLEQQVGYSRAVVVGDMCFVAGTTGRDPETGMMPEDIEGQVANAFRIIETALGEAGFALSDAVRVVYYVSHRDYVDVVSPLFGKYFGNIRPTATMVVAGLVGPEMKVEIEVTAVRSKR